MGSSDEDPQQRFRNSTIKKNVRKKIIETKKKKKT